MVYNQINTMKYKHTQIGYLIVASIFATLTLFGAIFIQTGTDTTIFVFILFILFLLSLKYLKNQYRPKGARRTVIVNILAFWKFEKLSFRTGSSDPQCGQKMSPIDIFWLHLGQFKLTHQIYLGFTNTKVYLF